MPTNLDASHIVRLAFEKKALLIVVLIMGSACLLCFVALIPAHWATELGNRINAMRESIVEFVGLLGATLGVSMGRGHMDARISSKDEQ